jgi:hypothetical protein
MKKSREHLKAEFIAEGKRWLMNSCLGMADPRAKSESRSRK